MMVRLMCKFGEMQGAEFDIGAETTIGRRDGNTIVLASSSIVLASSSTSTEHARIFWDDGAEN